MRTNWKPGDWAIYRKSKSSTSPGPRATNVVAARKGDAYTYVVTKFWIVESADADGRLTLRTAGGKSHFLAANDPCLRKPNLIERWMWKARFQEAESRAASTGFAA